MLYATGKQAGSSIRFGRAVDHRHCCWFGFLPRRLLRVLAFAIVLLSVQVSAWSIPAPPILSNFETFFTNADDTNIVTIELAKLPEDLQPIRACRATVDFAVKPPEKLLAPQLSFLEARALTRSVRTTKRKDCIVARRVATNEILATAECHFQSPNCILVKNVFVQPSERGKGLGRRLMIEGVDKLVAGPSQADVRLCVNTNNKPAIRLYESCSFQADGPAHAIVQTLGSITGLNLMIDMRKSYPRQNSLFKEQSETMAQMAVPLLSGGLAKAKQVGRTVTSSLLLRLGAEASTKSRRR